ncbi:MAG: FimV family protein [Lysobacterales bacterium]
MNEGFNLLWRAGAGYKLPAVMTNRQKNLPTRAVGVLLGLSLWFSVGQVLAVGFGEIEMDSYLNQPFEATVELLNAGDVSNLSVMLAGPSRYQQMDISPPRNLGGYSASLTLRDGAQVVRISSRQPVTDLVVDLVLMMNADDSESVRHYPVIIDFAPQLDDVVVTAAPVQRSAEPTRVTPVPAPSRVAAVRSGNSYGPVQSGQTLSGIVAGIVGDQDINGYDFMQAIVDLNPQAFGNGDMNRLRAGVSLVLPDIAGFTPQVLSAKEAVRDVTRAQEMPAGPTTTPEAELPAPSSGGPDEIVRADVDEDSRLELVGTPTSGEILNSLNRWLDEDDAELGVRAQEARRDLAYATAEIETYRKENDVLKGRVGELEGRIESLRKLIALRAAEEQSELTSGLSSSAGASAPDLPSAEAAAPVAIESELAASVSRPDDTQSGGGLGWWPWVLGVVTLLVVTIVVWYRGRREDQVRAQRTADLVHRIQQAGKKPTGEYDAVED